MADNPMRIMGRTAADQLNDLLIIVTPAHDSERIHVTKKMKIS
jgi:hypothetical protein